MNITQKKQTHRYKNKLVFYRWGEGMGRGEMELTVLLLFFFFPHPAASGILVPQPRIEPQPPAIKVQSPYHWTIREFPILFFF